MRLFAQRSDVGEFRRRYRWMVIVVIGAFITLVGRLVQLQLVEGEVHRAQARRNIVREGYLATTRGVIRDAYGKVLSANRPAYNVYITPSALDVEKAWPTVARLARLDDAERVNLEQTIRERRTLDPKDRRRQQQILVKVDVDRDAVAYLETHEKDLPGVEVAPSPVRYYPFGSLGAHMVGTMREVNREELAWLGERGYRAGDRTGSIGVERRWESYLRGQRGSRKTVRGAGRRLDMAELEAKYLEEPRRVEPIPGRDVTLTVDIELVDAMDKAMRGHLAGAVVVADVRTGRILAALSKPSFDPNVVSGGMGTRAVSDAFKRLYADPLKPTLDKTISAAYPPGSTYKPFTALAGLADGLVDPHAVVDCRGGFEYGKRYFRCTGVHRRVNLHGAMVQSCNTYFYELGSRISIDRLASVGLDFGFGVKTGIGVNPEARGRMPTRGWYTRRYKQAFYGGFTVLSAIGQGASTVTVLQLALAYAALANGGTVYQPQVVRSIETSDGTVVQEFPPRVRHVVDIPADHLTLIRDGLEGVVNEKRGTAYGGRIEGVEVAGKTGTAQVSHVTPRGVDPGKVWYFNRAHAWFAGYAPIHAPEIAIVVIVEHGGGGGEHAAPVAVKVVREWQKLKEKRLGTKEPEPKGAARAKP